MEIDPNSSEPLGSARESAGYLKISNKGSVMNVGKTTESFAASMS
jgi:hypothetical protein